jgi:glutathione S-transferase
MILHSARDPAPNPRRVRIFLAEKGLDVPVVDVDMRAGAHKSADFLAKNTLGQVPVLELDDGDCISESVSICRYLEALHPEPPLFGRSAREQAHVDMWIRRMEGQLGAPAGQYWRHAHPFTAKLLTQFRDFGESNRAQLERATRWLDADLSDGRAHLAGADFTMADIVGLTIFDFAAFMDLSIPVDCAHVTAWHARVSDRPSAKA